MKLLQLLLLLLLASRAAAQTPADSTAKVSYARLGSSRVDTLNQNNQIMVLTVKQYNDILNRLRMLETNPKPVSQFDKRLNEELEYRKNNRYER